MNNKSLAIITKRIKEIQFGLLRFHHTKKHMAFPVMVSANEDSMLNCVLEIEPNGKSLLYKEVNLIQKNYNDYVYISGTVCQEIQKTKRMLLIQIVRASWFVRQSSGNTSWLKQKLHFDSRDLIKNSIRA